MSEAARAALERIEPLLCRSLWPLDLWITAAEAARAGAELHALAPSDLIAVLTELERRERLGRLLDALDVPGREAFLELCTGRGLVRRDPPRPTEPARTLDPPEPPRLFRQDASLPRSLNDAIFEAAAASAADYRRRYEAYLDRYERAVASCASGAELRALGEVQHPALLGPPVDDGDPRASHYRREWSDAYPSASRAQRAVSARVDELLQEPHPGSLWLEAAVNARLDAASLDLSLDTRRPAPSLAARAALSYAPAPGAKVEQRSDGTSAVEARLPVGRRSVAAGASLTAAGHLDRVSASVGPVGLAASRDEVTVKVGSAYARGDGARLAGGVDVELGSTGGRTGLKAQLGVGLHGLTRAQAWQAVSKRSDGVMGTPPELVRGTPWAALAPDVRRHLERNAWTESEWATRLASAVTAPPPEPPNTAHAPWGKAPRSALGQSETHRDLD